MAVSLGGSLRSAAAMRRVSSSLSAGPPVKCFRCSLFAWSDEARQKQQTRGGRLTVRCSSTQTLEKEKQPNLRKRKEGGGGRRKFSKDRGDGQGAAEGTSSREEIRALRLQKVENLRAGGLEPYAYNWERTHTADTHGLTDIKMRYRQRHTSPIISCKPWTPLRLRRHSVPSFKCRSSAEAQSSPPIDVEATVSAVAEDEDDDYPLWMEEDDPTWPEDDPNGEGVGFKVDNFFEPKIMNVPNEDGSTDEDAPDVNWEAEQYQWVVREITSAEWDTVARDDPTPLIFFAFERYGPSGPECWKVLEELEKVVRIIVESRRYPIRAVKLDISSEPAVGDALEIMLLPSLLFINGGKLMYRLHGVKSAEDILAIASHVFYHSVRPACMDEMVDTSPHRIRSISSSGS